MFDFSIVTTFIDNLLRQTLGLGDFLSILIECVLVGICILTAYALIAIVLIFMERKVCAYFQCRLGPMRVGPWGIFQVFADVLKMLIKEIFAVDRADKLLYYMAPFLVIIASVGTFSFLPWNKGAHILDFNVGVFLITAVSSIGVLGVFLAGWASNNKYSVVSAMHGAGKNNCRNQTETERHLVRNHLYGTTHGRYHRVLVVRCPTSEEHTQNADRTYSCDEEYTYVEVKNMCSLVPWKE